MPIYEFYCNSCHVIFKFLSRRVDTTTCPKCPRCKQEELSRQISTFVTLGHVSGESGEMMDGIDETRMEEAFGALMQEAQGLPDDDPKKMASLMRSFTEKSGMNLGDTMEEAISRMEAGDDPNSVEQDLGDRLEGDDLFSFEQVKASAVLRKGQDPQCDEKLYEL